MVNNSQAGQECAVDEVAVQEFHRVSEKIINGILLSNSLATDLG